MSHRTIALSVLLLFSVLPSLSAQRVSLDWRYPTGGRIMGSPVAAADGRVYALSEDGRLYAFGRRGRVEWAANLNGLPTDALSVAAAGTVYAGLRDGTLLAVNPRGQIIWTLDTGSRIAGNPALAADGTIVVATEGGTLYAVALDGAVEWRMKLPARVTLSPLLGAQSTIYAGAADRRLYAITSWGRFEWSLPVGGVPRAAAVDAAGDIYVLTERGQLAKIAPSGSLLWRLSVGRGAFGPLLSGGKVYVAERPGAVVAYSAAGGRLFRSTLGKTLDGQWVIGRRRIYLMGLRKELYAADPSTGSLLGTWPIQSDGGLSVSRSGRLLVGGSDWLVYSYAGASYDAGADWAQPSRDPAHSGRQVGHFSEEAQARALSDLPGYLALSARFDPISRAALASLLDAIDRRLAARGGGAGSWYLVPLIERIASTGVLDLAVTGNTVANDFPTIRARAALLLGRLPRLDGRRLLVRLLRQETDSYAASCEIEALGRIGSDRDGAATRSIVAAYRRFTEPVEGGGSRVAAAAVAALSAIDRYSGKPPDAAAAAALLQIYRGPYPATLRAAALSALTGR